MRIRRMVQSDVEAVSQLEEESFSMPWSKEAFLEMTVNENAYYLVADEEGEILGTCGLHLILGEGEITNVAVKKTARGKGIATTMMQRMIEDGTKKGAKSFVLEVRKSNQSAIHVYEICGFEQIGIRKNFYELPWEDAVVMKIELENNYAG